MADIINIRDLEVYAHHGVFKEETVLGQKFLVSAKMSVDLAPAGKNDDLTKSVHYGEACHFIYNYLKDNTFQLIERAAEMTAKELLLAYPVIQELELEIKKPWAPIGLSLKEVSVVVKRSWHQVFLSIGSNMGDKKAYIEQAVKELKAVSEIQVEKCSRLIETKPYGYTEQDDFLNGAIELRTIFTPEELLDKLHEIEAHANRSRKIHWGPRTLDLDILMYDDLMIYSEKLVIPHIDMHNRIFVLEPLNEIAPYAIHPVSKKAVCQLYRELSVGQSI